MAGDSIPEIPKGAATPPADQGREMLLAQLAPPRTGRSLADEILKGKTGDTKDPPKEPPAPGEPVKPDAPVKPKDTPAAPATATDGKDVVLKLSFNDPKFDDTIKKTVKYNTLELTDFPKGAKKLQHWEDKDGFFFYLTDSADKIIGNKHYYPGNLAKITVDGSKPQDVNAERKKVRDAIASSSAAEKARDAAAGGTRGADVLDGVMPLSYKDPNFDRKILETKPYDTINLKDLPNGAKLTYSMDEKGFSFDVGDGKKHYFPPIAKQITVDGKNLTDLTRTRYEVIESYADAKFGGFKNFERQRHNPLANSTQIQTFADGINTKAAKSLEVLDKNLTEAVQSSEHHPYFKYLLANVKLAEAMGAMRDRVLAKQDINHPSVIDKIDKCTELLDQVIKESDGRLRKLNKFPKANAQLMPLAPYSAYDKNNPNGYYEFWGGTYDQATFMKPGVKFIRGMVEANALALPPARP